MKLENKGSLITYKTDDGEEVCLGSLINFPGRGVYDATLGLVEVSEDEMEVHNKLLDEALVKGLDENCRIGQGGTFYYIKDKVSTFSGTLVSAAVTVKGQSIVFSRDGKSYRGILQKNAECFNFKRIT